ncbi:unnamed protein product [Schistocephalus solidus]|uniref:Protein KRI1 homolog n=1 Tax=Schistocephalus solidus TaxID=70667 RepID=A0A183SS22_SCHSO|nr:unnamed protein product [Schistocephalus solidus]
MLHKATPDQITTNSFLADSAYRLYPSSTNLDAAVALEASEHKRKIAQLRHHFLTQLNFVVKDNAIQSTSPTSSTGFFPADSLKGTRLNSKLSEHPPSGLIFKSKSATDFTQLNLSAFRNIDPNCHLKNPSLVVSNNKAGVKSSNFLAERKSVPQGEQTTIPAFLHSADSLRASQSQQNPISNLSIKIDNNELHSLSLKTFAGDSSVHVPGCPIYTLSQCIGTTSTRGTETSLPRPANSTHRSTSYQLPYSELPNLDGIKIKDSEEVYRLPHRNFSPLPMSSKKTSPNSSSSSSICSPERSPQLLRRHERRTRSWQGRQQRHRSRPNVREQDRLLVDSLTRRIQPMLLEGRAAEVKSLLLHALAKPSTRERALRLIGYVSDALSSSWAAQIPDSPSATGVTTMGDSFSGLRLGPERPAARHSFSSDARSDRWGMGTGSTTSIHTPDFAVSASLSRGDPVGGNRNNNNNNSRYCGNNGGSYYALRLPPGGVVEPPPPPSPFSSASPPPKPFPPPSPKNAVMPSEERLRQLEARTLQLRDYNPLLITDLVTELTLDCSTDVEIVRSFFVWVTSKDFQQVDYDPAAAPDSFVGLLRNVKAGRVSVNELFHELCRFAGIPCHFISGRSKGAGYRPGMTLSENSLFRNTWLAVYVAKSWRFINCNWAARYRCVDATYAGQQSLRPPSPAAAAAPLHSGRNNLHSLPPSPSSPSGGVVGGGGYDEFYFLTEPSEHIYEHFPDKRAWQLLAKPISEKKFISLPVLKSAFFNTKLALKKPYSAKLITKNGQVSLLPRFCCALFKRKTAHLRINTFSAVCFAPIYVTVKLRMPKFVGISSSLENCADGSALRGLCLIEVLTQPADNVRVVCAPSQPGRYYLNVYVSSDWRRDDIRELACSFLVWTTTIAVECSEFNFSRLVVMGRLPEVGFLGRTPAAQHFGVVACGTTNGRSGGGGAINRPYILHTSLEPLKLPFAIASGLRICHQLKSFDRPSQQMTDCDNYALLQMRSHLLVSASASRSPPRSSANAHYHIRLPANAFFYFTVYAAYELDSDADHLECVYRILIDARRPTLVTGSGGAASAVAAFPRQTYWWVGCRLLEPTRFNLEAGRRHLFRLDAPPHRFTSIAVVINGEEWHFLEALSPRLPGRWSGKVSVGAVLGQLSIYGSLAATADANSSPVATCAMEFKINEDFAKRYNMYRQKEEYQKLKSRFGDVKISKKSANKTAGDGESDFDSDSSSSSSSSATSSTAEEWEQREHEDFLRLYDALCRGDPVVNDPNKTWFRPRPEEGDKEGIRMEEEEEEEKKKDDARSKKKKKKKSAEKPLLLKDHVRELLLSGDTADLEAQDVADSKNWNGKKNEDPSVQKHAFLRETEGLFEISDGEEAPLLQRKMPSTTGEQESQKACGGKSLPDTSHFTFAINGSGADQEFLRDYLVNRRWKSSEPAKKAKQQPRKTDDSPDALVDALLDATTAVNRNQSETTALMADEDLDADDEFLVKARQFEYRWNNNDANLIKSYPRNITSTLRQPPPGKLTRAEKRKAHEERKRQKKAAKMAELQHLKRLKIAEFAEKLERIRKTCGDGVSLGPLDRFANAAVEESAEAGEEETVAEEVVDALENDWNPEEHDRLVQKLFGKEYYGAVTGDDDLDEPPAFSDDDDEDESDLNSGRYQPRRRHRDEAVRDLEPAGDDEEAEEPVTLPKNHSHASAIERAAKDLEGTLAPRSRGRKRAHVGSRLKAALDRRKPIFDPTKNPDFEKYFDEFYQLDCEDILTGSRPGEDIHCRFKYREVKPNDFGLTTEEILAADDKELNRYASVKLMSAYRFATSRPSYRSILSPSLINLILFVMLPSLRRLFTSCDYLDARVCVFPSFIESWCVRYGGQVVPWRAKMGTPTCQPMRPLPHQTTDRLGRWSDCGGGGGGEVDGSAQLGSEQHCYDTGLRWGRRIECGRCSESLLSL